jgi:hypothetical protein
MRHSFSYADQHTNDHRCLLIKAACDWAVDGGFPLRRAHVHDVIVGIVKQEQREVRLRLRAGPIR